MPSPFNGAELTSNITPDEIFSLLTTNESFILNIVTNWCTDCTVFQKSHIDNFIRDITDFELTYFQISVQNMKNIYLSLKHKMLTDYFGGRGYPRTILVINGKIILNKVEVASEDQFSYLLDELRHIVHLNSN